MHALVTGANGFVGSWLARRLVSNGHRVRCLLRPKSDQSLLAPAVQNGASIVWGDVTDAASILTAVGGVEVVFHLAGVRRASTREAFFTVNAEGTRTLARSMLERGARRLVLCGSLAASGPGTRERPRREDDPLEPQEWYGQSKAEAERLAFATPLEVSCLRPARIVGPGDHENLAFFRLVQRGWILRLGGSPRSISLVDVEDVVDALLLLAERPEAAGQAFFCGSSESMTIEEMMRAIAVELGVEARTLPMPEGVLRALAWAADGVSQLLGRRLPLNRKLAEQLLAPGWVCDVSKAERVLGFRAQRTIASSLHNSARWYREQGLI